MFNDDGEQPDLPSALRIDVSMAVLLNMSGFMLAFVAWRSKSAAAAKFKIRDIFLEFVESVLNIDEVSFETLGLLLWTWNNKKVVPNCLLGGEKEFWAEVTYFQDMREILFLACHQFQNLVTQIPL